MKISKQVLISLRGRQSARVVSQKLGYNSNQFSRWESGHSRFSWNDFLDVCARHKLPLQAALLDMEFHGKADDVKALFQYLLPSRTPADIAKLCGVSKLTVQRWISNKISPAADVIFDLFTISGTPLYPLMHKILQTKKASAQLARILKNEEDRLSAMIETPWTIAVACVCLQEQFRGLSFRRTIKQLAKQIQLDELQVLDIVSRLIRIRLIGFNSEKNHFFVHAGPSHFNFRDSFVSFMNGAKFWSQFATNMIGAKKSEEAGENHITYLVFNCRSQEVKRVHEKIIALYKELADLSQQSEKSGACDRTFSLSMNLHNVNHPSLGPLIKRWNS